MNGTDPSGLPPVPSAIRSRLARSVGALVVVAVVLTTAGFALMGLTIEGIRQDVSRSAELARAEEHLHVALLTQRAITLSHAVEPQARHLAAFETAVGEELDAYILIGQAVPDERAILDAAADVRRASAAWRVNWAAPFLASGDGSDSIDRAAAVEAGNRSFAPITIAIGELQSRTDELGRETSAELGSFVGDRAALMVPIIGVVVIAVVLLGASLIRVISGPLARLNRTAHRLIAGEQVTFVPERDDEIGALAEVLERLRRDAASRYEAARVEAETAETFNQLAELTSFAQDEPTLVDAASRVLQRIAPSPRGQILLLNNSTNRLIVAATWGAGMPAVGSVAELDRPDRCPGIRGATAYVANDLADPLTVHCPAHSAKSGTVACLPMPALGSIVGVIHLERAEPRSLDPATIDRATRTAEQVALAIANARLMKTMEGLANTDPVTGLRNARFFDTYLEQQLALAQRERDSVGVIMLDLDRFKQFNDTHGHPAGDEALRTLGRTLRATIRESDVVARYGGEEFIVALHHATLAQAALVAEKIRAAVEQTVVELGPGRYGRITASFGVVASDAHRLDRKGLVALADEALYRAKAGGRNRVEMGVTMTQPPERLDGQDAEPLVLPVRAARRRSRAPRSRTDREQREA